MHTSVEPSDFNFYMESKGTITTRTVKIKQNKKQNRFLTNHKNKAEEQISANFTRKS